MKLLTGPLVLTVVAAARPFVGAPSDEPQAARSLRDVESAVVELVSFRPQARGAPMRHGSAFYVTERGHLLTCFHVLNRIPREDMPRLVQRDGREQRFEVVAIDREVDLALLLSDPPERFMALGDAPLPEVGARVMFGGVSSRSDEVLGVPPVSFRRCAVAAVGTRRMGAAGRAIVNIKVDQIADPGHSGGPLLAEETLAVVGVMRANLESATGGVAGVDPKGYGLAVPLMYVKPFLRRNLNLPASGRVSEEDKQEAQVWARHGWPGSLSCSGPPSRPAATSGRGSTP